MKRILVALSLLASAAGAHAGTITVKLGTMAPMGSPWAKALDELATKWNEVSNGAVKLEIAHDKITEETEIVAEMKRGQLQAAALTTLGLYGITPDPLALDLPSIPADVHAGVLAKERGKMGAVLEKKGYVVLAWVQLGPVRLFATRSLANWREAMVTVPPLADAKAWIPMWNGLFEADFDKFSDVKQAIDSGGSKAALLPVAVASAINATDKLTYMENDDFAQLTAALIVDKRTWESIPADLHPKLEAAAAALATDLDKVAGTADATIAARYKSHTFAAPTGDITAWWDSTAKKNVRGKLIPAGPYDEVVKVAKELAAKH